MSEISNVHDRAFVETTTRNFDNVGTGKPIYETHATPKPAEKDIIVV